MSAVKDYGKIGAFIVTGINNFSNWIKRKVRRDNVQGMDKDVDNNNTSGISDRLHDLKNAAKNRDDSK
jgi:hypothetical protein